MNRIIRKDKQYRITIEEIGDHQQGRSINFDYQDREDLFNAVDKLKQGSGLAPEQATQMAVAIRLLGPLMMRNRKHPLFINFMPHFGDFMKNLKATVKASLVKA